MTILNKFKLSAFKAAKVMRLNNISAQLPFSLKRLRNRTIFQKFLALPAIRAMQFHQIPRQKPLFSKFLLNFKSWPPNALLFSRLFLKQALRIINWLFVIGFIGFGLVLMVTFWRVGFVFIAIGFLISPYVNELLHKKMPLLNYSPSTKAIVAFLGIVIAMVSLRYENDEHLFLVKFSIQTIGLDYENEEQLKIMARYLEEEKLKRRKKAFFAMREERLAALQSYYKKGDYQEVMTQGTPYVQLDAQIQQLVVEAKNQLQQARIAQALTTVPRLMKARQYPEAYRMAVPFQETHKLQKMAAQAKIQIDNKVKKLRYWYKNGSYQKVIKTGTPDIAFDCRIKRVVLDAKTALATKDKRQQIDRITKQIESLIEDGHYQKALQIANQSDYAEQPELQTLIERAEYRYKKAQEKQILARLRNLPQTEIEEQIREYTLLVNIFPENDKYYQKLEDYKQQLIRLKEQPLIIITQQEYGEKWPFTVSMGELECFPPGVVTFRVDNKTYAVNGLASSRGFPTLDELWRDDPNLEGLYEDSRFMMKVDMGPIIKKGLDLCH